MNRVKRNGHVKWEGVWKDEWPSFEDEPEYWSAFDGETWTCDTVADACVEYLERNYDAKIGDEFTIEGAFAMRVDEGTISREIQGFLDDWFNDHCVVDTGTNDPEAPFGLAISACITQLAKTFAREATPNVLNTPVVSMTFTIDRDMLVDLFGERDWDG